MITISSSLTDVKQANKYNYPPISVIHSVSMVNPVRASEILNKIKLSLLCFSVTHRSFAFHSLYKTQGRFIYTIYREKYHYWFSKNFLHVLTIVLLRVREAVEYITPPGGRVREQQIGDRRAPLLTKIKRAKLVGS